MFPTHLQTFTIGDQSLEIFVPDTQTVRSIYQDQMQRAFWAQVWPASVGLCLFLHEHPAYIKDKNVHELAAGLGLAGLFAAYTARSVSISDIEMEAIACVNQSAKRLQLDNVTVQALDWSQAKQLAIPDILLLSDVNYHPGVFSELELVLLYYLQRKVTVIISTPQRLVAKDFINRLLPYIKFQWNTDVLLDEKETGVSVFVMT